MVLHAALCDVFAYEGCMSVGVVVNEGNTRMLKLCESIGCTSIEHAEGSPWYLYLSGRCNIQNAIETLATQLQRKGLL